MDREKSAGRCVTQPPVESLVHRAPPQLEAVDRPLNMKISTLTRHLALGLTLCAAVGCRGMAKAEVRRLADTESQHVMTAEARLDSADAEAYLQEIADLILDAARRLDEYEVGTEGKKPTLDIHDQFTVYIVHDPSPNAWVIGDDFVCVNSSTVLFAEHPEELAFVLAHEFGHLRGAHQVESIERRMANEFGAGLAAGLAAAGAGMNAANNPYYSQAQYQADMNNAVRLGQAIMASYSPHRKADEHEADAQAIDLLIEAGVSLERAPDFFARMRSYFGDGESESHPATDERLAKIEEQIAAVVDYVPTVEFDLAGFKQAQAAIRAETVEDLGDEALEFYSAERLTLYDRAPPIKACGPLEAPMDRVVERYAELIAEGSEGAGEAPSTPEIE